MRSALVVIDMVNDFVDGVLANPAAATIIGPIERLCARARAASDWEVVYASDAHRRDDRELTVFPPHAMAGTQGAEVVAALAPQRNDLVVPKRSYSAFTLTDLDARLRALDVGRLLLVGQHTDCCVRHTSYDAFCLGYELAVSPGATTVYAPGSPEPLAARQHAALEYLRTYYGALLEVPAELG
ncbi:MAG: cysteine hydrolase [Actinomycetota bacterium]|nr:cysteine hydrolase [Actinomycetota bacterium]